MSVLRCSVKMPLACCWAIALQLASLLALSNAFSTTAPPAAFLVGRPPVLAVTTKSRGRPLHLATPDHIDAVQSSLLLLQGIDLNHWSEVTTSQLLSDASTATAVTPPSDQDPGLWDRYLLIFKNTLLLVHSTIDKPLRSIGWDQTWGVSIFLFTASK